MRKRNAISSLLTLGLMLLLSAGCSGEKKDAKKEKKENESTKNDTTKEEKANEETDTQNDGKKEAIAFMNKRKSDQTKAKMAVIQQASKSYTLSTGTTPKVLDDLHQLPTGMNKAKWRGPFLDVKDESDLQDAWGNKIWIEPFKPEDGGRGVGVIVKSAGPNGKKGDEDDLEKK